jgi:hypothetical protein
MIFDSKTGRDCARIDQQKPMRFETGDCVVAILQNPREKIFGILDEISSAGVSLRGVDLDYFDDWSRAIASGEPYLAMSDSFIPMWRVEKISRDESSGDSASLEEQFEARTNMDLRRM